MKNLKKYFGNIGNTLLIAISLDSYRRTVNSDINNKETNKIVQETIRKSIELSNKLNDTLEQKLTENVEIQANLGRFKESLDDVQNNVKILSNFEENNNETNKTLITESSKTLKESSNKANELINKLLEYINNKTNSGNSFTFKIY
jgi:Sec-independent protein translocase protein TatA